MYKSRRTPNPTSEEVEDFRPLKSELHSINTKIAKQSVTEDWTVTDLEAALKTCKNNKARDIYGHTYELFKFGGKSSV